MSGSSIELDRARLAANLEALRSRLEGAHLMAVVKANAYGHGAALVAPLIRDRVDWYGVDALLEAEELKALDLKRPILILGHTEPSEAATLVAHGFRQALFRRDVAEALSRAASASGTTARVHVKVETGLHRLGVPLKELADFAEFIAALDGVEVEGVYTHFAEAENPASTFSETQRQRLRDAVAILRAKGLTPSVVHAAPTAAVLLHERSGLTLGRVGIGLYGVWPSAATREASAGIALQPVLGWKCRLVQVKTVPEGEGVGYDKTYETKAARRIGVIPVGYYDGFDRKLSNRAQVLVRGRRAPVVGRVAMNMCMVDVTEAGGSEGDEVVLLGEQGDERITADEMAGWAETIAYEVVARLNPKLPRRIR